MEDDKGIGGNVFIIGGEDVIIGWESSARFKDDDEDNGDCNDEVDEV